MDEQMEVVHQVTVRSGDWKLSNSLSEFVPVVMHGENKV